MQIHHHHHHHHFNVGQTHGSEPMGSESPYRPQHGCGHHDRMEWSGESGEGAAGQPSAGIGSLLSALSGMGQCQPDADECQPGNDDGCSQPYWDTSQDSGSSQPYWDTSQGGDCSQPYWDTNSDEGQDYQQGVEAGKAAEFSTLQAAGAFGKGSNGAGASTPAGAPSGNQSAAYQQGYQNGMAQEFQTAQQVGVFNNLGGGTASGGSGGGSGSGSGNGVVGTVLNVAGSLLGA